MIADVFVITLTLYPHGLKMSRGKVKKTQFSRSAPKPTALFARICAFQQNIRRVSAFATSNYNPLKNLRKKSRGRA